MNLHLENRTATGPPVDAEMMARVATGDRAVFTEVYRALAGPLFSVAMHMLHNREEAEEVTQEIFVKIWKDAATYDPQRGTPFAWALTMTRSKSIDRLRSRARRDRGQTALENELPATARHGNDPAGSAAGLENARTLQKVIAKLVPEQREAIDLAFFEGLTQAEIAEKLREPIGTIKARIRRGLLRLRDLLAGKV